ncbi:flavin reductase family protein [Crystallibacter degradans]|uniref:flavin reductase family protein n=1 Tax=Crystallibacter degradans TaxID=2726743 RepID=UPI0017B1FA90|nr:flavin reductase family protein [Arthrobacter sp. SF27]NMR32084.1 flavin reductase family protein [Arthrobacter sp. SF27]
MTIVHSEARILDPAQMRTAMAAIPTSVSVVAGDRTSTPAAIVVGSFVSISLDPPLIGFFVGLESTSWPHLQACSRLGISVLSNEHHELVRAITKKHAGRFDEDNWASGPRGEMLVRGGITHMTGPIRSVTRVGDHDFVVVELESAQSDEERAPLVFHGRCLTTVQS